MQPVRHLKSRILIGLFGSLVVAISVVNWRRIQELDVSTNTVGKTVQVLFAVEDVVANLREAEATHARYIVTGDASALMPLKTILPKLDEQMRRLTKLTDRNFHQQEKLTQFKDVVAAKLALLDKGFGERRTDGFAAARKFIMDQRNETSSQAIRIAAGELSHQVREDLNRLQQANQVAAHHAALSNLLEGGLAILALGVVIVVLRMRSITRLKGATVAIEAREQRTLLDNLLGSMAEAVIATDTKGQVRLLNPAAQMLTGWSQIDAEGRSLEAVFHVIDEKTRTPLNGSALLAIKQDTAAHQDAEMILVSKVGTEWPIESNSFPIQCEAGIDKGVVLIFHEVAKVKSLEKELERQALLLRLMPLKNDVQPLPSERAGHEFRQHHGAVRHITDAAGLI